ncbi:MAG: N-6 DNA methylase [Cyanobacteria bacterium J06607_13]
MHQLPYRGNELQRDESFDQIENQYLEHAKRSDRKTLERYSKMLGIVIVALAAHPCDFLGEVLGELELHNSRAGQFFTPFHVSRMMARMQVGNLRDVLEQKPVVTVADHACGAGGMLLAFALEVIEQGIDPRSCIIFDAIDVDRRCFNMCYLQLSASGLIADVHWGNTLSLEFWEHRQTMQRKLFNEWARPALQIAKMRELLREVDSVMSSPPEQPANDPVPAPDLKLISADQCEQLNIFAS